jgi:hypothetical protein
VANVVVAEDIAGTDDHGTRKRPSTCGVIEMGPRQSALEVPNKAEMAEWRTPWEVSPDL